MIVKRFKVDVYSWEVIFIVALKGDEKQLKKILKKEDIPTSECKEILADVADGYNFGRHIYNTSRWSSVVVIANASSLKKRAAITAHELRHVEDRILEYVLINDKEAAAFLSGYLAKKIYPLIFKSLKHSSSI